jgi:hypothetical protein
MVEYLTQQYCSGSSADKMTLVSPPFYLPQQFPQNMMVPYVTLQYWLRLGLAQVVAAKYDCGYPAVSSSTAVVIICDGAYG